MHVVLDTNIIVKAAVDQEVDHVTVLDRLLKRQHKLVLDHKGHVLGEYCRTAGKAKYYQKWYSKMVSGGQIEWRDGSLSTNVKRRLLEKGLHEPVDQVLVALALNSDRYLVTEDSDFGNGSSIRAQSHYEVYCYLCDCMDVVIHDAEQASEHLDGFGDSST